MFMREKGVYKIIYITMYESFPTLKYGSENNVFM